MFFSFVFGESYRIKNVILHHQMPQQFLISVHVIYSTSKNKNLLKTAKNRTFFDTTKAIKS